MVPNYTKTRVFSASDLGRLSWEGKIATYRLSQHIEGQRSKYRIAFEKSFCLQKHLDQAGLAKKRNAFSKELG